MFEVDNERTQGRRDDRGVTMNKALFDALSGIFENTERAKCLSNKVEVKKHLDKIMAEWNTIAGLVNETDKGGTKCVSSDTGT